MDSIVSARVAHGKKEAGNRMFEKLGTNASQAINDLYDYVIECEELPFGKKKLGERRLTEEELAEAREWLSRKPRIHEDYELLHMTKDEIRQHRYEHLMKKHGVA